MGFSENVSRKSKVGGGADLLRWILGQAEHFNRKAARRSPRRRGEAAGGPAKWDTSGPSEEAIRLYGQGRWISDQPNDR